jgi:hypothetical protein
VLEFLGIAREILRWLRENPEIFELLKRLFGRAVSGEAVTLELVAQEVGAVQQLRATGGPLNTGS